MLPEFLDNWHMKVKILSAKHIRHVYTLADTPCTYLCQKNGRYQGHSAEGRIKSIKMPSGIEPATSRLVSLCINKLRHGLPQQLASSESAH